jgi:glutaredoxin domain-containing cysteine-rich protein 1
MGGLRSRILRTLQSFPNAAAATQTNLLPPPAPNAGASPQKSTAERCGRIQQEPAPPQEAAVADGAPKTARIVSDGGWRDGDDGGDKENVSPEDTPHKAKKMKLGSDHDQSAGLGEVDGYRRPDLASATLFDPDLLAAFRSAVDAYAQALDAAKRRDDIDEEGAGVAVDDPLEPFERRCPPGGERAVVLYTTSLRGVRKTFEDCARVRRLLEGLRVAFLERDVSMHAPYRDELRALRPDGAGFPVPPRLFVDGRYIGGADEVVALHERSQLRPVLWRAPRRAAGEAPCAVCGGAWFVVCGGCSGSHWLHDDNAAAATPTGRVACTACNESGLVPCPLCS